MLKKTSVVTITMVCLVFLFMNCENSFSKGKKYTIKLGHVEAEDRSAHRAAVEFKEYLAKQSDGEIVVELYPNSILGGDNQLTEAIATGTIQMGFPGTSAMTMYDTTWGVLDMPFLFDSAEACFKALDGELGKRLGETLKPQGIYLLGFNYNGARSVTNSKRPVNEPADLKGIKMRVVESPVFIDLFNTLGANATPMNYSELFTGLQQKTVDAQENCPSVVYTGKFYEVQKYYSLTEHVHSPYALIIGADFFDGLPKEYQALVTKAAREIMIDKQRAMEIADNEAFVGMLEKAGMEINYLSPENKAKFREAVQPMYKKYEKELGTEIFDLARKTAE